MGHRVLIGGQRLMICELFNFYAYLEVNGLIHLLWVPKLIVNYYHYYFLLFAIGA